MDPIADGNNYTVFGWPFQQDVELNIDSSGIWLYLGGDTSVFVDGTPAEDVVRDGLWHTVAIRRNDSGTLDVILDGKILATFPPDEEPDEDSGVSMYIKDDIFQIGGWYNSQAMLGQIAELCIYNQALSDRALAHWSKYVTTKW
jgi:hypothetical protein